jgi:hypothetical protein
MGLGLDRRVRLYPDRQVSSLQSPVPSQKDSDW